MRGRHAFYARYLNSLAIAEREPGKHSWYRIEAKSKGEEETEVYVYDEIGFYGIRASDFLRDIKAVTTPNMKLRLSTPGGVVTEAHAMFNGLVEHPSKVTTHIDALAASMGSILALTGSEKNGGGGIHMAKNAFYMIHNPWGVAIGDDDDMMKTAEVLGKMKGVMANAYQDVSGKDLDEILGMMKAETWFTAEEAKAAGFIDSVIGEKEDKKASFDADVFGLFHNVPSAVIQAFKGSPEKPREEPPASIIAMKRRQLELLEYQ